MLYQQCSLVFRNWDYFHWDGLVTWPLAAVQMFFLSPLASLPDAAALRKTGKWTLQAWHDTVQRSAGVLPDVSQSVEMDWLKTQNDCRNSPQFGCSPGVWPLMASSSSIFCRFSLHSLVPLLSSSSSSCSKKLCRRDQLGQFPCKKTFISLIVLPHLFLLTVGSRDTIGGKARKRLFLDHFFSITVYECITGGKTLALFNHLCGK